MNIIGPTCTWF